MLKVNGGRDGKEVSWLTIAICAVISLLILALLKIGFWGFGGTDPFTAYDCHNRTNKVDVYLLTEPEACHSQASELKFVRVLSAEIIQVKKTRMITV